MHFLKATCGAPKRDEIDGVHFRPLVEQLEERMLAVGARFPPNNRTRVPRHRSAVSSHKFPVAFHVRLLQVGWQAVQVFGIGYHNVRAEA